MNETAEKTTNNHNSTKFNKYSDEIIFVIVSFICNLIVVGSLFVWGMISIPLQEEFGVSNYDVMWVCSVPIFVEFALSPFVGKLIVFLGFRLSSIVGSLLFIGGLLVAFFSTNLLVLILSFSVYGVSIAVFFITITTYINIRISENHVGLSMGIVLCSSGIGNFILPFGVEFFMDTYGWRYGILFICLLGILTFSLSIFISDVDIKFEKDDFSQMITKKYILVFLFGFFLGFGYMVPYIHITAYSSNVLNITNSYLPLSLMGIFAVLGHILQGYVSDNFLEAKYVMILDTVMMCFVPIAVICDNVYLTYIFSSIYGYFSGSFWSLMPVMIHGFWPENTTLMIGYFLLSLSMGNLFGPPISGYILDITDSYLLVFVFASIMSMMSILPIGIQCLQKKKKSIKLEINV